MSIDRRITGTADDGRRAPRLKLIPRPAPAGRENVTRKGGNEYAEAPLSGR
jgi:hypothetical protein